jgi:hypothetical protein
MKGFSSPLILLHYLYFVFFTIGATSLIGWFTCLPEDDNPSVRSSMTQTTSLTSLSYSSSYQQARSTGDKTLDNTKEHNGPGDLPEVFHLQPPDEELMHGKFGVHVLEELSDRFTPVSFNHSMHVLLANDCWTCHHQHELGEEYTCGACHVQKADEFKTSVIHSFWKCTKCHGICNINSPEIPCLRVAYHQKCFICHQNLGDIGNDPKGCYNLCHQLKSHPKKFSNTGNHDSH